MVKTAFNPRARLMLLLGNQLIRDAGVAVFELVKNAYDADAQSCTVTLHDIDSSNACVVIEDNGCGMSLQTVRDVWMSPGTDYRLDQRESGTRSAKYGRLPLGEKGVGRFGAHKLGQKIELVTRAMNEKEVHFEIDWGFFDTNAPLSDVIVSINCREPCVFHGAKTGTRITISELHETPWTRRRVRSLHRAVTSICSPAETPDSFDAKIELVPDPDNWLKGMLTPRQAISSCHFRIKGAISPSGVTYSYRFRPPSNMDRVEARTISATAPKTIEFPHTKPRNGKSAEEDERVIDLVGSGIGEFKFDFAIFDRDRTTLRLMPGDSKSLTDFLDINGGVRVYREGVRVFDFGEPGNDWLELGGRRVNVPARRIGNNQIIGVIELKLAESEELVEKTNREGFVENYAALMFRRAVRFAIAQAEFERNEDKKRIRIAYTESKSSEPVLGEIEELRVEVAQLHLEKADKDRLSYYLDQIDIQYRGVLEKYLTAAGAGLNLAIVVHEVEKQITSLYDAIIAGAAREHIMARAKELSELVDTITWLTRQSGKKATSAESLIKQCLFAWQFRFQRHGVMVVNGIEAGDPDFEVRCIRRLIMTALMNLIDNSIYWLGTKSRSRKIYVGTTYELHGKPSFVVADNGPGFQDSKEHLVSAFFSRKPDGMGLGLHLADEIMKTHRGRLILSDSNEITLPEEYNGAVVVLEFDE